MTLADRLVSVNDNFDLPEAVAQRQAARLADATTPEGIAAGKVANSAAATKGLLQNPLPFRGPMGPLKAALALIDTNSPAVGGTVNIVFAGSSTTAGHTTEVGKRWIDLLAAKVTKNPVITDADYYNKTYPKGINIINAGVNGGNSATYLAGLRGERVAYAKPRLIVHTIGANDFANAATSLEAFAANLRAEIDRMNTLTKAPVSHLLVQSYERFDYTLAGRSWDQYRAVLMEIAQERPKNVAFLDLSETFRGIGISTGDSLGLMMSDKIHLNDYGHRIYADMMDSALGLPHLPWEAPVAALPAVASDDFARADGPLGTTPVGAKAWTAMQGTIVIAGEKATATAVNAVAGTPTGAAAVVDTGLTDATASIEVDGVQYNCGLLVRGRADGSGYYFMWSGSGVEYRIGIRNATGNFTKLVGTGTTIPTFANHRKLSLTAKGGKLTAKADGVTILETTDTTLTGTSQGIVYAATGFKVDNFRVDAA